MLTLRAPAKINWFLKIRGKRDDGYHEIQSLLQKITLFDTLKFSDAKDVELTCDSQIPFQENLIYKAAVLMKENYGVSGGAAINLKKEIPIGAGLGGGSSDAASTLRGLNELWSLNCSPQDLCRLGEQLGSDVPFFLYGPLSFVSGRGEKVSSRMSLNKKNILLVKPQMNISTAWVYATYSVLTKKPEKVNNIEHFIRNFENAELRGVSDNVLNDLESVTAKEFPVIDEIKNILREQGAFFSLMSGSGPTVFGVFESRDRAEKASHAFSDFWTAVVETIVE